MSSTVPEGGTDRLSNPVLPVAEAAKSPPQNPTSFEQEVYKTLAGLYNSEESSFWTRNNILMAVHGFLIAATANIVVVE